MLLNLHLNLNVINDVRVAGYSYTLQLYTLQLYLCIHHGLCMSFDTKIVIRQWSTSGENDERLRSY